VHSVRVISLATIKKIGARSNTAATMRRFFVAASVTRERHNRLESISIKLPLLTSLNSRVTFREECSYDVAASLKRFDDFRVKARICTRTCARKFNGAANFATRR